MSGTDLFHLDGAGPLKRFWTIVFPLLSPSAQSVILMVIVVGLTAFQFRYIERKVTY